MIGELAVIIEWPRLPAIVGVFRRWSAPNY